MFKLLHVFLLIVGLQSCCSGNSAGQESDFLNFIVAQAEPNRVLSRTDSASNSSSSSSSSEGSSEDDETEPNDANYTLPRSDVSSNVNIRKTIPLPDGLFRIPLPVLEVLSGKDCKHLVSDSKDGNEYFLLTADNCQSGFHIFETLMSSLGLKSRISELIPKMIDDIPSVIVQSKGGEITVSNIISSLFKSTEKSKNTYTPFENLLFYFCFFQAEVWGRRMQMNPDLMQRDNPEGILQANAD